MRDEHMLHPLALLTAAIALLCWPLAPQRALPQSSLPQSSLPPRPDGTLPDQLLPSNGRRRSLLAGCGLAGAVLLLWPDAPMIATAAGIGAALLTQHFHTRPAPASAATRTQLALLFDLWAAGLECGLSPGGGLSAALKATDVTGPAMQGDPDSTRARLIRIAGLLQLGADPMRSWLPAQQDPQLLSIAGAARRSSAAGVDLATTIREQADAVRRADLGLAQRRAERAGVLMAAPLALCFLPSFLCLGLAPVVIALIDTLDVVR